MNTHIPPRTMHPRPAVIGQARRAFSLLELMISIMILGLGLVMVATVFPVSMGMSRETLQMSIAQAAADTAHATLRLRVPALKKIDTDGWPDVNNIGAPKVLFAKSLSLPADVTNDIQYDAVIDSNEYTVWSSSPLAPRIGPNYVFTDWAILVSDPHLNRTRVYTEWTGWRVDRMQTQPPNATTGITAVLPSQNVFADGTNWDTSIFNEYVPMIGDIDAIDVLSSCIDVVDRLYPPVRTHLTDGADRDLADQLVDVKDRRYTWTVIQRRCPLYEMEDVTENAYMLTILVTHRSKLSARFAKQLDDSDAGTFTYDLTLADDQDALKIPSPDSDSTTDTLFPQPWLVMFETVDVAQGQVTCSSEVARLLPTDSVFVEAFGGNAGTPHRVLGNSFDPAVAAASAVLQIARSDVEISQFAWVIPPPILVRDESSTFGPKTPVVGVFMREVVP